MREVTRSVVLLALGLWGCGGGDDGGLGETMCRRMDDCNALGTGNSVSDCVQESDADLAQLSPAERHDLEKLLEECLEFRTCDAFIDCSLAALEGTDLPGGDGGDDSGVDEAPGYFTVGWSIERGGLPATCAP